VAPHQVNLRHQHRFACHAVGRLGTGSSDHHAIAHTLIVTAGCGLVQRWDGPIAEIRPGDVVRCPLGGKHWHGATPTAAMPHIATQEQLEGKIVDSMEKVSAEQTQARFRAK
jgi:quercetin dioxygenase-like cupin family protein